MQILRAAINIIQQNSNLPRTPLKIKGQGQISPLLFDI